MRKTLEERFKRVEDCLIGLWRFRVRDQEPLWAATFSFEGQYYDVSGKKSPGETLDAVYRDLGILRKNQTRRIRETVDRIDETQERVFVTLSNKRRIVILSGREYSELLKKSGKGKRASSEG
jgi:hypothetical protein